MKELILNADDFGFTRGVNEGIVRAHREGVLTSTTLMANGPAFEDAVERARECSKLGVGCHLVLIGGSSVAPCKDIPSLADADGNLPKSLPEFVVRVSSGAVRSKDIDREFSAQIEKLRSVGIEPTHLDTHKHTHAHPRVMKALCRVARNQGILRIRNPFESLDDSRRTARLAGSTVSTQLLGAVVARAFAPRLAVCARQYGLRFPSHFLGLAVTGKLGPVLLRKLIESLPDGQTEIMLHPGIHDADLASLGALGGIILRGVESEVNGRRAQRAGGDTAVLLERPWDFSLKDEQVLLGHACEGLLADAKILRHDIRRRVRHPVG